MERASTLPDSSSSNAPSRGPHPRQREVLGLTCEEALYGGAAGGGKTWFLLKWLGEGAETEGYSGGFFRRTYAQLAKSNDSPIAQSFALYQPLGGVYTSSNHTWKFPSGAKIEFGHLQHETSIYDYQGAAFHRIAWDELTQFSEQQYTYLFSRLRRRKDFPIACGVRAASNPGGQGHFWVKKRFVTDDAMKMVSGLDVHEPSPPGAVYWPTPTRAFVPARVADNPSLDVDEYITRLREHLSPVLASQMAAGDWRVSEGSLVDAGVLRYYTLRGDHVCPLTTSGEIVTVIEPAQMRRFATIDTAGTSKEKAAEQRGKPPSWSVCAVWDYSRTLKLIFLRHVWRARVAYQGLRQGVVDTLNDWHVEKAYVENAHFGQVLADDLRGRAELVGPTLPGMLEAGKGGSAKLERATSAGMFKMLEDGLVYLPEMASVQGAAKWLPDYESELLAWTGNEGEAADQIDPTSYACYLVKQQATATWGPIRLSGHAGRVGLNR